MDTDACLGFPVMAYRSRGIAYGHYGAWQSTLVRIEGRLSKSHDGKAGNLFRRAKVGYCPCCACVTHVAIPPSYSLGPHDGLTHTGILLWAEFGPWAPRRLAATEYSMRYIERYPVPAGWDWAAKALDFKAPDPFIRGAPGGEPGVISTIAQTEARNIASPMPDNNKEAQKAITDRTTLDTNKVAQQTSPKGSKGVHQQDGNCDQKGRRADFRRFDWTTSPSRSPLVPPAEGSMPWSSIISKGDPYQKVPPYKGMDTAVPSSSSPRGGTSKGSNLFRQERWRGLRRKEPRPDAPRLGAHQEPPAPESSASSDWTGWRDWSDRGKRAMSASFSIFFWNPAFFFP